VKLSAAQEATSCAATQELPHHSMEHKGFYRIHKTFALVPILNQTNPIHTATSYF
jgi:hypothetical protein